MNTKVEALPGNSSEFHVVFGAGGSKAILGAAGAIAAFELCGFNRFATIGGISGGAIPAALYAHGVDAHELLRLSLAADFSKFLINKAGLLRRIWALLSKYRYEMTKPRQGIYSGEPLKNFIDENVSTWSKRFWTLATSSSGHSIVLMHDGSHWNWTKHRRPEGFEGPMSVGTAVLATCAIPGIIDPVLYSGWHLFDGAIGDAGSCPTEPVEKMFGASPDRIIAFDMGEDTIKSSRILRFLWHLNCGGSCGSIEGPHPDESRGNIVIAPPPVKAFHGLSFNLSKLEKWMAITVSFSAAVRRLDKAKLIAPERRAAAIELCEKLEAAVADESIWHSFVSNVEALFAAHGFTA